MTTIIEQMARAIAANNCQTWEALGLSSRISYARAATAALTALLEPSEAMMKSALTEAPMSEPKMLEGGMWGRHTINTDECAAIFRKAIQAALDGA